MIGVTTNQRRGITRKRIKAKTRTCTSVGNLSSRSVFYLPRFWQPILTMVPRFLCVDDALSIE